MAAAKVLTISTGALASLLGVTGHTVANWVEAGDLKAYRTKSGNQGKHRITIESALALARRRGMPVEHLESLLAGRGRIACLACPSVLVVANGSGEDLRQALLQARFDVSQAPNCLQAGLILSRRAFAAVVMDASLLQRKELSLLSEWLTEESPDTVVGLVENEDAGDSEIGLRWRRPCDWARAARELWQRLRGK
jgi:hypothetical protein